MLPAYQRGQPRAICAGSADRTNLAATNEMPLRPRPEERAPRTREFANRDMRARLEGSRAAYLALLRRHPRRVLDWLDLGGAILEFGNFPERVERRVGEQVRRRLHERERDEHDAVGNGVVLARNELDGAAPGRHAHHVAGLDAELDNRAAGKVGDGARLQRVERGGAPRHRAGVPVLEL